MKMSRRFRLTDIFGLALLVNALLPCIAYPQSWSAFSYPADGYAIEVPASWHENILPTPTGGVIRAFMDTDKKRGAGYCQVEVQSVDKARTPKLAAMNANGRREYHRRKWTFDDWLQIYPNLASAQSFRFLNSYPTEVGVHIPASAVEFGYSIPKGYAYHVRAHVVLASKKMFSLWCISIGHNEADADNNFRRYLPDFQAVAAKFKPTID